MPCARKIKSNARRGQLVRHCLLADFLYGITWTTKYTLTCLAYFVGNSSSWIRASVQYESGVRVNNWHHIWEHCYNCSCCVIMSAHKCVSYFGEIFLQGLERLAGVIKEQLVEQTIRWFERPKNCRQWVILGEPPSFKYTACKRYKN